MSKTGVFLRVLVTHLLLVALVLLLPLFKGCTLFEKQEQVITVDLGSLPPPPPEDPGDEPEKEDAVDENVIPEVTPQPTAIPTATPIPAATPAPTPGPEPTAVPASTPRPTSTPKPAPTPTPAWRAKTPEEIRQSMQNRPSPAVAPVATLSPQRIRAMIGAGLPESQTGGEAIAGNNSGSGVSFDGAGADLYARLHSAWQQPTSVSAAVGLKVLAAVEVRKNGTIASARIRDGSGNEELDASVKRALSAVTAVQALPNAFTGSSRTFEIEFVITR